MVFALTSWFHLLDMAGPAQVFSTADRLGVPYRLEYLADTPTVESAQGVTVTAETGWRRRDPAALLVVPGWRTPMRPGSRVSPAMADFVAGHHAAGGTVVSVCSGAFALGQAGLLAGRRCTTHHELQAELARRHPAAVVVPDVLFTTDGRVVTSAGIASGIDLALHLVAVWHGPPLAARIARDMVVYARRNGDAGQDSAMLRHRSHLSDVVHRVQDRIDGRFAERLRLDELAGEARVSPRTLTRMFVRATGLTPLRYQQSLRLERARDLIGRGVTVDAAARSVGFADARMLRRLRARAGEPEGAHTAGVPATSPEADPLGPTTTQVHSGSNPLAVRVGRRATVR
ncbi:GlxA family transcriptional regulator [Stackebrandtia albiflava]